MAIDAGKLFSQNLASYIFIKETAKFTFYTLALPTA